MLKKNSLFVLSLGIVLGVIISVCGSVVAEKGKSDAAVDTEALPFEDLRTFTEIFAGSNAIMSNPYPIKNSWKMPFAAC